MQSDFINEKQILIKDFIWQVLKNWKRIIIMMLVFGVALGALGYVKAQKGVKASQAAIAQAKEYDINKAISALSADEQDMVLQLIDLRNYQEKLREDIEGSAMMQLDCNHVPKQTLIYRINSAENQEFLTDLYSFSIRQPECITALAACSDQIDEEDVTDLITIADADSVSKYIPEDNRNFSLDGDDKTSVIVVFVRGFSEEEVASMTKIVEKNIDDYKAVVSKQYKNFEITLADSYYSCAKDEIVEEFQYTMVDKLTTIQARMNGYNPYLTADQKLIIADYYKKRLLSQAEESSVPASAGLPVKFILIGMIAGAFLSLCIDGLIWLFDNHVMSAQEYASNVDAGMLEVVDYRALKLKGLTGALYGLLNPGKNKLSYQDMVKRVAGNISLKCKDEKVDTLYLTGTAVETDRFKEFINDFKAEIEKDGISVIIGKDLVLFADALIKAKETGYVVYCEETGTSMYHDIYKEINTCKTYNINVTGTICLER